MSDSSVLDILNSYKKRLINLTARNKSILLLKPLKGRFFDLNELDFQLGAPAIQCIETLLQGKKTELCQYLDKNRELSNHLSLDLKKIYQTQQSVFEEQGTLDLCVGWPFVQGKMFDDSLVRCPLLLFPVSLNLINNRWLVELRVHEITLNPSFLLYYSRANQVSLDMQLVDFCIEEKSELLEVKKMLYDIIKSSSYEIHFPTHLFEKRINSFNYYNKKILNEETKTGVINVVQEAVLGFFPQSTSSLLHDYNALIERVEHANVNGLDDFFEKKKEQDTKKKELQLFAPYEMDAWQERILEKVDNEGSLLVQGPPGSGKSQLIVNLISNAVAKKKSVLLVCQKRVALDVVYERLEEYGFSNFIGLIHDFKYDRKKLYSQLKGQVEMVEDYEQKNSTGDNIEIERNYMTLSNQIDALCHNFKSIKEALYNTKLCGIPIKELYLLSSREGIKSDFGDIYSLFPMDKLEEYLLTLTKYYTFYFKILMQGNLWLKRSSFSGITFVELEKIKADIKNTVQLPQKLSKLSFSKLKVKLTLDDIKKVSKQKILIEKFLTSLKGEEVKENCNDFLNTIKSQNALDELNKQHKTFIKIQPLTTKFKLSSTDFLLVEKELKDYFLNKKSKIRIWYWKNFTKRYAIIKKVLSDNLIAFDTHGILLLSEQIKHRNKLHALYNKVKKINTKIPLFNALLESSKLQSWSESIFNSTINFEYYLELKDNLPWLHQSEDNFESVINAIQESSNIYKWLSEEVDKYHVFLSKEQVKNLLTNEEIENKYIQQLDLVFDELCGIDKLTDELDFHWQKLFTKITAELEQNDKFKNISESNERDKITLIHSFFVNSLCFAWLGHAERSFPELSQLGNESFKNDEEKLAEDIYEKRVLTKKMVLQELETRVFDNLEYNRLKNRVTYRDLLAQVSKKRRIWPIRKLFSNYNEEILKLMPCWLASPESVSAVFPMLTSFDLVIFDEASQCFAEKAIPALMRGKQTVIVGDNQQLQPFDLYSSRYESNVEEDTFEEEAVSILDLMQKYYSSISLQGHYRSQHDTLIRFSNEQFYNNKLMVVPYHSIYKEKSTPIEYKNIQGRWLSRQNVEEAEYVCQLLKTLTAQNIFSIGVITFNASHRDLIIDRWSEASNMAEHRGVFIKNIENVQGDERDIIIFSVGYGFDENNKLKAQFGSLNIVGGENRLNVAVSRARKKMIIITSFEPNQLEVEHTVNAGPKLLKEFLLFAKSCNEQYQNKTIYSKINIQVKKENVRLLKNIILDYLSIHHKDLKVANSLFADIHLVTPSESHLLIFVDDGSFYFNDNPKSFHAYLPTLFAKREWMSLCLYSRQYWWDKDKFFKSIDEFILTAV